MRNKIFLFLLSVLALAVGISNFAKMIEEGRAIAYYSGYDTGSYYMSAVLALPILFVSIASLIIQFLQANEKKISIVTYILSIVLVIILLVVTSINNLYYKEEIESLDHMTGSEAEGEKIEFVAKIIYMWLIFGLSVILLVLGLVIPKKDLDAHKKELIKKKNAEFNVDQYLRKYKKLYDDNVITLEEFNDLKDKIINDYM